MPHKLGPKGGKHTVTPGGFVRTTVFLDPEDLRTLRHLAAERGVSTGEVLREALSEYLERQKPEK